MECVKLDHLYQLQEKGHSSKGNQLKVRDGRYWYKADYMGYEGLAEYMVSNLLKHSSIKDFVKYDLVRIECKEKIYHGCKSENFLKNGENLITLEHLYRQYTGRGLARQIAQIEEAEDKISFVVKVVEDITGLKNFGEYLTAMLELDAFFLNEDRHMNNIAVIYNKEKRQYRTCEYFDHGLALLADTIVDFTLEKTVEECIEHIEAKPFSRSFDEQMDAAEKIYGQQLFLQFDIKTVLELLQRCEELYGAKICSRVEKILRYQMRKYRYLFAYR